jgi:hypothetical protein
VRRLEDYIKFLEGEQQARLADMALDRDSSGNEDHPLIFSQTEMGTGLPDPVA